MKLWLLRHGEASFQASCDAERALTVLGQQQVVQSAALLKEQPLDAIFVSPYRRARQSAGLVAEHIQYPDALLNAPWLVPDSDVRTLLQALQSYESRQTDAGNQQWLLVGHQPLLGAFLGFMQHASLYASESLLTGQLACLEGELLAGLMQGRRFESLLAC